MDQYTWVKVSSTQFVGVGHVQTAKPSGQVCTQELECGGGQRASDFCQRCDKVLHGLRARPVELAGGAVGWMEQTLESPG